MRFTNEFMAGKDVQSYDINDVNKALSTFNKHPNLMRNLVGLYNANNKDVSEEYNCFYEEMINNHISTLDIDISAKYIKFENEELAKIREFYEERKAFDM